MNNFTTNEDSNIIELHCPHCDRESTMENFFNVSDGNLIYYVGTCQNCGKPVIYDRVNSLTFPASSKFENVTNLPESIDKLYKEINISFSNGAYTCSILASRILLMHIAIEQGADKNMNFVKYVEYISDKGIVPINSKDWIDSIREIGNRYNHEIIISNKEDAETTISFIKALLTIVYQLPAEAMKYKNKKTN